MSRRGLLDTKSECEKRTAQTQLEVLATLLSALLPDAYARAPLMVGSFAQERTLFIEGLRNTGVGLAFMCQLNR
jgi:hypothetical protein